MNTPTLREFAQAVLDLWDSPQWQWTKHGPTADLMAALRAALAAQPVADAVPVAWREHVEQRIRGWRQRTMNRSGDRLALDDMMGQDSIDDLIDYVCDEWAEPAGAAPGAQQPEPDIPPGWESSYAIGDLLLAVSRWKVSTPRDCRPAFDDLVKACAALVAAAHPQQPAPLTEAQLEAIMFKLNASLTGVRGWGWLDVARAIERAHGIPATPAPTTGDAS